MRTLVLLALSTLRCYGATKGAANNSSSVEAGAAGSGRRLKAAGAPCSLTSCVGVNLLAAIKKDLKPWSDKGGITSRDLDAAERALSKVEGYIRVSIVDGALERGIVRTVARVARRGSALAAAGSAS